MAEQGSISFEVDMNVTDAEQKLAQLKKSIEKAQGEVSKGEQKKSALEIQLDGATARAVELEKKIKAIKDQPLRTTEFNEDITPYQEERERQLAPLREELKYYNSEVTKAARSMEKQDYAIQAAKAKMTGLREEAERVQAAIVEQQAANAGVATEAGEAANETQRLASEAARAKTESEQQAVGQERTTEATREAANAQQEASNAAGETSNKIEMAGIAGKDAGETIRNSLTGAFDAPIRSVDKFINRIGRLAKRALVFSVITRAFRSLRTYISEAVNANEEASKSFTELKAAAKTAFQPVIQTFLPIIVKGVQYLTSLLVELGKILASMFGMTYKDAINSAEAIEKQGDAADEAADKVEDARQRLAGFDTIQTIDTSSDSASTSTSSSSAFGELVNKGLTEAQKLETGAGLLVIGALLAFSGTHLLLGITMMALGARMLYDVMQDNPDAVKDYLQNPMNATKTLIAGLVLLCCGLLVMLAGHLLVGLAMVAFGATAVYEAYSQNPKAIKDFLQKPMDTTTLLIGGLVLLCCGLLVMTAGHPLVGLFMVVTGALAVYKAWSQNPNAIKELLQDPTVAVATLIAGLVLICCGLLVITAGKAFVGLAMVVFGALAVYEAWTQNPDAIEEFLESPLGKATALIAKVVLVAIGLMCILGGNAILGLGLVVAGAKFLKHDKVASEWSTVIGGIRIGLSEILTIASAAALAIGIILLLFGGPSAKAIGIGAILAGAYGLWDEVYSNQDTILPAFMRVISNVIAGVGTVFYAIGYGILGIGDVLIDIVEWFVVKWQDFWLWVGNIANTVRGWFKMDPLEWTVDYQYKHIDFRFTDNIPTIGEAFQTMSDGVYNAYANWYKDQTGRPLGGWEEAPPTTSSFAQQAVQNSKLDQLIDKLNQIGNEDPADLIMNLDGKEVARVVIGHMIDFGRAKNKVYIN